MISYLTTFTAVFFVDIFYTYYLKSINDNAALKASIWGAVVWLIGSFAVIEYTANHLLLIPACLGAFCGTYVGMKLRKGKYMKASHILVDTLEQASAILAEANTLNFGSLAQTHSKCPSKMRGGDLGEFGPGQMVKPFEDATQATPVGAISQPVQTQFGYHLIHRTG